MKRETMKFSIVLILVVIAGFTLAKIDTSKNWNDTGVTVGLILISSFTFGAILPRFAWLWAIILSGLIFCFNVIEAHNYGAAGAILFAFAGAYSGVLFRKLILTSTMK